MDYIDCWIAHSLALPEF